MLQSELGTKPKMQEPLFIQESRSDQQNFDIHDDITDTRQPKLYDQNKSSPEQVHEDFTLNYDFIDIIPSEPSAGSPSATPNSAANGCLGLATRQRPAEQHTTASMQNDSANNLDSCGSHMQDRIEDNDYDQDFAELEAWINSGACVEIVQK